MTNKQTNKKFAIFITSYNYGEYISQAIESVINQTDQNWNLYIIDNCSTDNTKEIVKKYVEKDYRICWKQREKNIGGIQNILRSFAEIDADYICSLSADDWLETKFIEENRKAFAENPEIPFCASGWLWFNENDKIFRKHIIPFAENFKGKVFLSPYLVFYNFVGMNSIVFNKYKTLTNFFAMLDYLERAKTRQNVEVFMMKFLEAKYGASYFINAANSVIRQHNKNLSNDQNKNYQGVLELVSEPLFYCQENLQNNLQNNTANIATKYISLIGLLGRSGIPYKVAAEWLLNDLGKPFAEKIGNVDFEFIKANNLEKSLICLAICVWNAFISNCNFGGWENDINKAKQTLQNWIKELSQQYKNLRTMKAIYKQANKLYDGFFMPSIK